MIQSQLTRVQVYLENENLEVLDKMASQIRIKRSQIIRDSVAAATNVYFKTAELLKLSKKPNLKVWMKLAGVEESKTGDLGMRVDEIYK